MFVRSPGGGGDRVKEEIGRGKWGKGEGSTSLLRFTKVQTSDKIRGFMITPSVGFSDA